VAAVRHRSGASVYTYEVMYSLRDVFADFETAGTVFGAIGGKDFRGLSVVVPPVELISMYESTVGSIGALIERHYANARSLADLRDCVLPRLMFGAM
jgi:type I restriction enzyme S subunit